MDDTEDGDGAEFWLLQLRCKCERLEVVVMNSSVAMVDETYISQENVGDGRGSLK